MGETVYKQRTGSGAPRDVKGGLFLYLWGGDGLTAAVDNARNEIDLIAPQAVILHDNPSTLLATLARNVREVRRRHPNVRVFVGVGGDGTVGMWRKGTRTAAQVIAPMRAVAKLCEQLAVEVIVWNCESQWKDANDDAVTGEQIEQLAIELGREVTAAAPNCVHWLSSFDQPNLHGALRFFMRGFTAYVSAYTGQAYVAVAGGAEKGALGRRLTAAERGQELAERAGYLPDDVVGVDTAYDVDRIPTIQGYATPLPDVARCAAERTCCVWSLPMLDEKGRADPAGVAALAFATRVRDSGLTIEQFQRARGLTPDGIVGPMTLRAAGVTPP